MAHVITVRQRNPDNSVILLPDIPNWTPVVNIEGPSGASQLRQANVVNGLANIDNSNCPIGRYGIFVRLPSTYLSPIVLFRVTNQNQIPITSITVGQRIFQRRLNVVVYNERTGNRLPNTSVYVVGSQVDTGLIADGSGVARFNLQVPTANTRVFVRVHDVEISVILSQETTGVDIFVRGPR